MLTCFSHKNMTDFDTLTFRCYFLQNNISIYNSSILSYEKLELSYRYLPATVKDHMDNITWIDSSYIINILSQNVHILERKRNDIFKHIESLKIHEQTLRKVVYTVNKGLSSEGTATALKTCLP